MTCEICRYRHLETDAVKQIISVCRRYPPTWHLLPIPGQVQGAVSITRQSGYPQVQMEDWCGEFQRNQAVPVAGPLG
jgi:hypothetical protein